MPRYPLVLYLLSTEVLVSWISHNIIFGMGALPRLYQTETEAFTISVEIIVITETGYEVVDLPSTKTKERRKWNVAASIADPQSLSSIFSLFLFFSTQRARYLVQRTVRVLF